MITSAELIPEMNDVMIRDVYSASSEIIPGSFRKAPQQIDDWITALPPLHTMLVY